MPSPYFQKKAFPYFPLSYFDISVWLSVRTRSWPFRQTTTADGMALAVMASINL